MAGSYLWDGSDATDLGDLGGGNGAKAFSIRDNGIVLGTSLNADGELHLFQYGNGKSGGQMADLGNAGIYSGDASFLPLGISAVTVIDQGISIGLYQPETLDLAGLRTDANGNTRSLLWKDGGIHSVIDLMPAYLSFQAISHAYGSMVLINNHEQIACAGKDTAGQQTALLLSIDPDTDNDGLPDSWEMQHYGHLGVGKDDPADGGGGLTNWQAYQQGADPNDFFNGQAPVLTVVQGDAQAAAPGSFVPLPLIVRVTNVGGIPAVNASVTFTVSGEGLLQRTNIASPKPTVSIVADSDGKAKVFFQVSSNPNIHSQVLAKVTVGNGSDTKTFDESSNGGETPPDPTPPDPGNPVDPQEVPVQSYACIDISGTVQGNNDVNLITLNDSGVAAFGFKSGNTYSTYRFIDGQPNHVQDLELEVDGETDDEQTVETRQPWVLDSQGTIYAAAEETVDNGTWLSTDWATNIICQNGVVTRLLPPDPPYGSGGFGPGGKFVWLEDVNDSGYCGTYHGYAPYPEDPTGEIYRTIWGGFICCGGSTIETGNSDSEDAFFPMKMNDTGSAIGARDLFGSVLTFRDGITGVVVDLDDEASAINDQNQIVSARGGSLWENGRETILANHLPAGLAGKIQDIRPYTISNQTAPGTDATIYILATANVTQPDGTVVNDATIVCSRDNDGDWWFALVGLPDGTTISQYTTINSSGVIAGIGSVSVAARINSAIRTNDSPTPSPKPQAVLLPPIPVTLKVQPQTPTQAWQDGRFGSTTSFLVSPGAFISAVLNSTKFVRGTLPATQIKILQDVKGTYKVSYDDGSFTTCNLTVATNPDGFVADDDNRYPNEYTTDSKGNLTCLFKDFPNVQISWIPRQHVTEIYKQEKFRLYVQVLDENTVLKDIAEVDWSCTLDIKLKPPSSPNGVSNAGVPNNQTTPHAKVTIRGGKVTHTRVQRPAATNANTIAPSPANWQAGGTPGGRAYSMPYLCPTPQQ